MKRSAPSSPTPSSSPSLKTPPPSTKKTNAPATPRASPKKANTGDWTDAKRAAFIDEIIVQGYKTIDMDALSKKLGVSTAQLKNQLTPGRSNLRSKIFKFLKGE